MSRIPLASALALAALAAPALAGVGLSLTLDAPELALKEGQEARVTLTLSGQDEMGGAYDLFVAARGVRVDFPADQQTQGILLLPGQDVRIDWTPTVRRTAQGEDATTPVTFTLLERPTSRPPRSVNVTLLVHPAEVAAPSAAPGQESAAGTTAPAAPLASTARLAALLGGGVALAAFAGRAVTFARRRGWLLGALYWRVRRERLLEHPVRAAIVDAIREEPGITRAKLQRRLALADGQADHHLRRLVRSGVLVKVERNGQRLLFVAGAQLPEPTRLAERVRAALADGRAVTAREVAARVGASPQLARYYLDRLSSDGVVVRETHGLRRLYRLR